MIKKTIKYTDYSGVERVEEHWFNLNDAEVVEMEMSVQGGLTALIEQASKAEDNVTVYKAFQEMIRKSYGVKSLDGKRFMKKKPDGTLYVDEFEETEAYPALIVELLSDSKQAAEFFNRTVSANAAAKLNAQNK